MLLLGLDSSTKAASCAVFCTDTQSIISYGGVNTKITHSETLLPLTENILKAAKLTLNDIDAFAVTAGPGSFTGVRIAASAVKGMAFALNKPLYAVSTLHALAYNLRGQSCIACCNMDARREQFYNALFRVENEVITRLTEDRAIGKAELEAELQAHKNVITVDEVSAISLCRAALEYPPITAKELMPFYLRAPQAERERIEKTS
ncbi:MAG: tRNA (adenosine(37)-N6)-threonylcarbamoyltransferase complex dimerization subunit type 1 TsaB [Oscillospiraceae bacterium]|nr:tRNA (adenosine(37)-N6)-threonylcarbamoyltransferase complex dimerization subunit type 1 TsaB [Oscillospiraceae bacterium]